MKSSFLSTLLVIIFLISLISGFFFEWGERGVDDAFITYRFAKHVAEGRGFIWNYGDNPVYGSTSFLYTLILSASGLLNFDIPQSSICIEIITRALSGIFIVLIGIELGSVTVGLTASLLFAINPAAIIYSSGLETQLYVLLILATFYFYLKKSINLCALSGAFLIMTRIDGLLVPLIILLHWLIQKNKIPLKPSLIFLSVLSPWIFFSLHTFGSLLPNSLYAKRIHEKGISGEFDIIHFIPEFKDTAGSYTILAIMCSFAFAGLIYSLKKSSYKFNLLIFWAMTYYLAYMLAGLPDFTWYYVPLLFLFFILVSEGAVHIARSSSLSIKTIGLSLFAVTIISLCFQGYKIGRHRFMREETAFTSDERYKISRQIMSANSDPNAVILI